MSAVLDASALLAYLQEESGAEVVGDAIGRAAISTVNWAEVVQRASATAEDALELRQNLRSLGLSFLPFTVEQAESAGRLREPTARFGLSLGGRACLAVGMENGATVYTADRVWQELQLDVEVRTIR